VEERNKTKKKVRRNKGRWNMKRMEGNRGIIGGREE
jgi:hypothetical protein